MRVLIVDNKSAHLTKLQELVHQKLGNVEFVLRDPREMFLDDVLTVDLVVFSGGWGRSIEKNPGTFKRMVNVVVEAKKPAIGICLGAEAIAVHYGTKLIEMPVRRVGNIPLKVADGPLKDTLSKQHVMAYEFHKWLISEVHQPLITLATSKDGVECFKHASLPIWGLQFHPEVPRLGNIGHEIFEYALRDIGILQS
jgi:GMP synthase-like glutamine amidotransferase